MLTEVATLVVRHMGKVAEKILRQTHMGEARHCVPGQVDRIELHMRQIVQPVGNRVYDWWSDFKSNARRYATSTDDAEWCIWTHMYTLSGSGEAFIDGICFGGTSCGCSGRAGNSGGDPRPSSSGAAQCASKMRCDSAAFSSGSAVLSTRHAHSASVVGSSTASAAAALAAAPCAQ